MRLSSSKIVILGILANNGASGAETIAEIAFKKKSLPCLLGKDAVTRKRLVTAYLSQMRSAYPELFSLVEFKTGVTSGPQKRGFKYYVYTISEFGRSVVLKAEAESGGAVKVETQVEAGLAGVHECTTHFAGIGSVFAYGKTSV